MSDTRKLAQREAEEIDLDSLRLTEQEIDWLLGLQAAPERKRSPRVRQEKTRRRQAREAKYYTA